MDDSTTLLSRLMRLAQDMYKAGKELKAAHLYGKGVVLATHLRAEREKVHCLFWQGHCLWETGRIDDSIPVLMEAGNCRAPEVDPADVFNTITNLIEISLSYRPEPACRALLTEACGYLASIGKQAWHHKLDHLEGKLDLARGEWEAADQHLAAAWAAALD